MKRAIYDGSSELKIIEVEKPVPSEGEVLVRVEAATICGTDVHILEGNQPALPGTCLGHEFAGIVEKVGDGVTSCKEGDLVSVEPHIYCGVCKPCRTGKSHLCVNKLAFGVNMHGGFEQFALIPQQNAYTVPDGVESEEAALTEAIGCCLHGIDRVAINPGDDILIFGGGVIGMILLKLCLLKGASKVYVSEPIPARQRKLLELGATVVLDPSKEDIRGRVADLTGGLGPDVIIECAGRKDTAALAVDLAARGGRILYFGIVPPGETVSIEPNIIFKKELTIVGSAINPDTHHRVIELLTALKCRSLITDYYPLERINEAIEAARTGQAYKICIKPNA